MPRGVRRGPRSQTRLSRRNLGPRHAKVAGRWLGLGRRRRSCRHERARRPIRARLAHKLAQGGGMQDTEGGPKTLPDYSTEHSPCSTESILRPVRDVGPTPLCLVKAGAEVRSEARVVTAARGTRLTAPVPIRPRAHGARPPAREARAEALGRAAVAGSSHGGSSKSRPVDQLATCSAGQ